MTDKERLRSLVEKLSEERAPQLRPLVEARLNSGNDDWAAGQHALDRLDELTADLPPFDAVQAAAEARLELDQRPAS